MKIRYEVHNFRADTLAMIGQANAIIDTYAAQGYDLTLRQLYYQFVSRDLIRNKQSEYKRLGDVVSKARRAGLISWEAIVDRTRNLRSLGTWDSPQEILEAVAGQFRYDRWATQPTYVEVWFEKDALLGVFERIANQFRAPFFSCRGYTSDSEVWGAAQRLRRIQQGNAQYGSRRDVVILHFGDHDPSGLDMTRDIRERLALFGASVDVRRLALNMDQIEQYDPPPNPAKDTDSRFVEYQAQYGDESWELDALEPTVLAALVRGELDTIIEPAAWNLSARREQRARASLRVIANHYDEVVEQYDDEVQEEAEQLGTDEAEPDADGEG